MLPIEFKKSCVHETPSPHGQDALKISLRDFSSTLEGVVLHDVMGNSGGTQSGNYCFLVRTDSFLCWKKKYLLERRQIRKKVIWNIFWKDKKILLGCCFFQLYLSLFYFCCCKIATSFLKSTGIVSSVFQIRKKAVNKWKMCPRGTFVFLSLSLLRRESGSLWWRLHRVVCRLQEQRRRQRGRLSEPWREAKPRQPVPSPHAQPVQLRQQLRQRDLHPRHGPHSQQRACHRVHVRAFCNRKPRRIKGRHGA